MAAEQTDKGGATDENAPVDKSTPDYRRAARLLGQKLGVDWRDLPAEQVIEYMRKIEIGRQKTTNQADEGDAR